MRKQIEIFLVTFLEIAGIFMCTSQLMAEMPYTTTKSQDCGQNYGAPKGRVGLRRVADPQGGWQTKGFVVDSFGPMPQTAYDPNYGCYPGNARTINRYPAFHGYYYARPYNYRHYAEYPWNAEIVEPRPYEDYRQIGTKVDVPTDSTDSTDSSNSNDSRIPSIMDSVMEQPVTQAPVTEAPKVDAPVSSSIPETEESPAEPATKPADSNSSDETILDENVSTLLNDDLFN